MPKAKYTKRKDGRFFTNFSTGEYKEDGKPERIPLYGKTSAELDVKVADLRYKLNNGLLIKTSATLFQDYASNWFIIYKTIKGTNTKKMYKYLLDTYIVPVIGQMPLKNIRMSDIQMIINKNKDHYRTCCQIRLTLNQIFKRCIKDDLLYKNPCEDISMPAKTKVIKRALTNIEKKAILKAEFTDKEKAFVYILYFMGLRKCECLGLTKKDFDFKKKELNVNRDLIFYKGKPEIRPTKNIYSVRSIPIPNEAFVFIKKYVLSCFTEYIFTKADGGMITESSFVRMWESIKIKINTAACTKKELANKVSKVDGLTCYVFRHNYATMLYYSKVSLKKASYLMGHCDVKMLMEVYAHLDEQKENTASKLNAGIKLA